jgi:hypothetical protein
VLAQLFKLELDESFLVHSMTRPAQLDRCGMSCAIADCHIDLKLSQVFWLMSVARS